MQSDTAVCGDVPAGIHHIYDKASTFWPTLFLINRAPQLGNYSTVPYIVAFYTVDSISSTFTPRPWVLFVTPLFSVSSKSVIG